MQVQDPFSFMISHAGESRCLASHLVIPDFSHGRAVSSGPGQLQQVKQGEPYTGEACCRISWKREGFLTRRALPAALPDPDPEERDFSHGRKIL